MKKTLLIIGGILFILVLLGIWLYLLFFGAPENVDDVFSDFSSGGDAPVVEPEPNDGDREPVSEDATTDVSTAVQNPLRQITTEPVIGKQIISIESTEEEAATSTNAQMFIRYAEAGTGHVYDYDPQTSERVRISSATIPEANNAYISLDGTYVVIESQNQLQLITVDDTEASSPQELSFTADNPHITEDNIFVYTNRTADGTTGYAYNLETGTLETLFTTPMQWVTVSWGLQHDSQHIIYSRPADSLIGYAYHVTPYQSEHKRLPIAGFGLTLLHNDGKVYYSTVSDPNNPADRTSFVYDTATSETVRLANTIVPDKCVFSEYHERLWCANDSSQETSLSSWYKGTATYSDSLWSTDPRLGSSRHQINPMRAAGRSIDVAGFHTQNNQPIFLLTNKIDRALWLHDPTL